jgi:hypothetical protein
LAECCAIFEPDFDEIWHCYLTHGQDEAPSQSVIGRYLRKIGGGRLIRVVFFSTDRIS